MRFSTGCSNMKTSTASTSKGKSDWSQGEYIDVANALITMWLHDPALPPELLFDGAQKKALPKARWRLKDEAACELVVKAVKSKLKKLSSERKELQQLRIKVKRLETVLEGESEARLIEHAATVEPNRILEKLNIEDVVSYVFAHLMTVRAENCERLSSRRGKDRSSRASRRKSSRASSARSRSENERRLREKMQKQRRSMGGRTSSSSKSYRMDDPLNDLPGSKARSTKRSRPRKGASTEAIYNIVLLGSSNHQASRMQIRLGDDYNVVNIPSRKPMVPGFEPNEADVILEKEDFNPAPEVEDDIAEYQELAEVIEGGDNEAFDYIVELCEGASTKGRLP